jgi:hypothetical protein
MTNQITVIDGTLSAQKRLRKMIALFLKCSFADLKFTPNQPINTEPKLVNSGAKINHVWVKKKDKRFPCQVSYFAYKDHERQTLVMFEIVVVQSF